MQEKARHITEAAEKLFLDRRFDEVTLDEVAREACVGKGTIYRYFDNKQDLYLKTLLAGLDELVESLGGMADPDGREASLVELARQHVRSQAKRRPLFALLRSEELRRAKRERNLWPEFKRRIRAIMDVYRRTIERGIQEGRYRRDVDPELAASFLMGMLRNGGRVFEGDENELADRAVKVLEGGIMAEDTE